MDAAGNRLSFASNGNLSGRNPDRNFEIFLYSRWEKKTIQVTDSKLPVYNENPVLSGDGQSLYFRCRRAPAGDAICRYSITSGETEFITGLEGAWLLRKVSKDGKRLLISNDVSPNYRLLDDLGRIIVSVQTASADIDAAGEFAVYATAPTGQQKAALIRLTVASGRERRLLQNVFESQEGQVRASNVSISSDGLTVCFISNLDAGRNRDRSFELFCYDSETDVLRQLTSSRSKNVHAPAISGEGNRVVFYAHRNLLKRSSLFSWFRDPGLAIFLHDFQKGVTLPLVEKGCDFVPGLNINDDGTVVSFSTTCISKDNEEVYVAEVR